MRRGGGARLKRLEEWAATALDFVGSFHPAGERVAAPPSFLSAAAFAAISYRYQTPLLLLDVEPRGEGPVFPSGLPDLTPALTLLCRGEKVRGGLRLHPNFRLDLDAAQPHPIGPLALAAHAAKEGSLRAVDGACERLAGAKRLLGPVCARSCLGEAPILVGGTAALDLADPLQTIVALLLATGSLGPTRVVNASSAPEVIAFARLLTAFGCRLQGLGTPVITLEPRLGRGAPKEACARPVPDRPSVNLLLALVGAAGGSIEIAGVRRTALGIGPWKLKQHGVNLAEAGEAIRAWGEARLVRFAIATSPFPGADSMEASPLRRAAGEGDGARDRSVGWEEPDWSWDRVRLVRPGLHRFLKHLAAAASLPARRYA